MTTTDEITADDMLDVRDIIARVEELRGLMPPTSKPGNRRSKRYPDEAEELNKLEALLDDLRGQGGDEEWEGYWYPVSLIRDSYFVEAMQDLVQDIGDLPREMPGYLVIDWDATADNLRADYSSVEFDGETYWYR